MQQPPSHPQLLSGSNVALWISRADIEDHFNTFIFDFIFNDIEQCIKGKANYVVALALLSYTEYLGALISGNVGLQSKGKVSFDKALSYFLKQYSVVSSLLEIEYKDNQGKVKKDKGIYHVFRCGVVHEYFIKGPLTKIINNPNGYAANNKIGIEIEPIPQSDPLFQISPKRLIFRTNEYFRDFKSASHTIYQDLLAEFDSDQRSAGKGQSEFLKDSELKSPLIKGFFNSLNMYSSRKIL